MSVFIDSIKEKVKQNKKTIILPESEDLRVLKATEIITKEGFANIVLIGDENQVNETAKSKSKNFMKSGPKIIKLGILLAFSLTWIKANIFKAGLAIKTNVVGKVKIHLFISIFLQIKYIKAIDNAIDINASNIQK